MLFNILSLLLIWRSIEGNTKMTKDELFHKNLMLSKEFCLYLVDHPEIIQNIPDNAIIVLSPEDDPELAEINLKMAEGMQEEGQPLVLVKIGKLRPITSRITEFSMEIAEGY
jgi:hypothetical protein